MKIHIVDWCGEGIRGTRFEDENSRVVEGSHSDAFDIAKELFHSGKNVMILRVPESDTGTRKKPNIVPENDVTAVDTKRFQQR